jgi:ABC-type phosphate transport system permease subunit
MTRADNRGLAGIPSAVLGLFVAGNLLVVVSGLLALVGAGVLEALTRRRA